MYADKFKWEDRYKENRRPIESPSPFLLRWANCIEGPVLDVAGGNGRNALYLAARGLTVHVIDICHAALLQLNASARRQHLPVFAVEADLENYPLPVQRYGAVLVFRYLQRTLFPALKAAVRAGGLLLYESFLIHQQALGPPRNPRYLLEPRELYDAFRDFEVLSYEEGLLEDPSPAYLARLVARRPHTAMVCSR